MIITARWKGGITNDKKYFSEKVQEKVLTNIKNCQFNNQTTRQPNNNTERFGWKPIPSVARVTRDEVSGLPIMNVELSGRQYPIYALTRLWLARHVQNQSRITHD